MPRLELQRTKKGSTLTVQLPSQQARQTMNAALTRRPEQVRMAAGSRSISWSLPAQELRMETADDDEHSAPKPKQNREFGTSTAADGGESASLKPKNRRKHRQRTEPGGRTVH
eukprot:738263-Rhodomonas_salina.2